MVGFLGSFGYHVLEARSAAEAISLSADYSDRIQLLVTDIIMPRMNGWDLSLEIIKSRPELKCLFISGYVAEIFEHNGAQDADVPFLGKPFSRFDLARKIREVLTRRFCPYIWY